MAHSSGPESEGEQYDEADYAMSFDGHRFRHNIVNRTRFEKVVVRKTGSSKGVPGVLKKDPELCKSRPETFTSTTEEQAIDSITGNQKVMLVVGLYFEKAEVNKPPGGKRFKNLTAASAIDVQESDRPFRVVASYRADGNVEFYALLDPLEGLCEPYKVSAASILCFGEYRSSSGTTINERRKDWINVILDKLKAESAQGVTD